MTSAGSLNVQVIMRLLDPWQARLLAGEQGLTRAVTWASVMRARLPAFEGFSGGELALLSLARLRSLHLQLDTLTLPQVVDQLAETGVSAIAVAGLVEKNLRSEDEEAKRAACARADAQQIPLIALPASAPLHEVESAVLAQVRGWRERQESAATSAAYVAQFRASLRSEALAALLSGAYTSEALMRERAAQLGYDLSQPFIAAHVDLGDETASQSDATRALELAEALEVALGAWTLAREHATVALAPVMNGERGAQGLRERLETLLTRALGTQERGGPVWSAGLGELAIGPANLRQSAAEARDAASLGRLTLGPRRIARQSDLGVYRLLLSLRDSGALAPFVRQTLQPLDDDRRSGDLLLETLEVYFAHNGNALRAAQQLHLHRNSMLYRLRRVSELLGQDLEDPDVRLALQVALKGRRVLEL
ncbi:MAG TPA: helix-turn-helix domain-containing protein [Ktedonobacterales bacterium]|nr:helix-turn-helix domain-containing protein [Ktedonobacterales bacterium]